MQTELERYKEAVKYLSARCNIGRETTNRVNSILHPPPEMEEVEVESWMGFDSRGVVVYCGLTRPNPAHYDGLVKLTGSHLRPKPPKVERSVSAEVLVTNGGLTMERVSAAATHGAPFRGIGEINGKEGVLTFTWYE